MESRLYGYRPKGVGVGPLVAYGTVDSSRKMCHGRGVPADMVVVTVKAAVVGEARLPLPPSGTVNVGEAVHGFWLWPKELINAIYNY